MFIYFKELILFGIDGEIKVCYDINCVGFFIKCVIFIINVGDELIILIIKGKVEKKFEELVGVFINEGGMFNNGGK